MPAAARGVAGSLACRVTPWNPRLQERGVRRPARAGHPLQGRAAHPRARFRRSGEKARCRRSPPGAWESLFLRIRGAVTVRHGRAWARALIFAHKYETRRSIHVLAYSIRKGSRRGSLGGGGRRGAAGGFGQRAGLLCSD